MPAMSQVRAGSATRIYRGLSPVCTMGSVMSQIFLPNTRLSPYHAATEAAGATEYMVYNHMYMPLDYGRPPTEDYRALRELSLIHI